ncbi:MAG: hypothetical protein ACOX8H_11295 [Ruminococcus sp.]
MSKRTKRKRITVNRQFKSTVFAMLYSDKRQLLELYNAVNGTQYADPELLEVNTLENAIYVGMKNDLSFLIASRLYLYEHQSTVNPNLPLRFLLYISDLYSDLVKDENLYGSRKVQIPPPRFLIFYNGEREQPDIQVLKLSELFALPEDHPALELEAVMLNINKGHNRKLMEACKSLRDYAEYTDRVRRYAKEMKLPKAVERAVAECIEEGILTEFLRKNRAEVIHVSIYEYDAERHMRQEKEESWEDGHRKGLEEGHRIGLEEGRCTGLEEGRCAGREEILMEQIKKKLEKGLTPEEIADILEEEEETIKDLIERIKRDKLSE